MVITCDNYHKALTLARTEKIGVFFIPTFFLHFTISFLGIKNKKWLIRSAYLCSFIFAGFCHTKYMIPTATPRFYAKYFASPGILYHFAVLFFIMCVTYCLIKLFAEYKKSSGIKRNQLEYLWWSLILGYVGGGANFLLTYGISIPFLNPFGTYASALYVGMTAYAILRHQLMDITIVIRKTAIYSIVATIITIAYFILIYVMEGLFRGFIGYKSIPWTLSVIVLFTFIFQPLKNMVQVFIDTHFFKGSQALLQEELKKTQEELKRSERLKAVGTLAAGMAHEIKNSLTGIKTFTEYLPSKGADSDFRDRFHKIVSSEVNKINDIVQQLLDFSKPKPLQLKPCNIHNLINQTLSFLNNDFIKGSIKVNKNYDPAPSLLNIDPNQIQQVFLNLFLNSIDAMKEGGTLTITTQLTQNNAEIIIQDTGIGISKKDLEHVFDPFYSTKEKGTGLGMSIVYGIIKEHKGEISVESEVGKGASFKIRL